MTRNRGKKRPDQNGDFPQRQLRRVYKRDKGICQLCNQPCAREDASREHVKRLGDGGSIRDSNVVLAHIECNGIADFIHKGIMGCLIRQSKGFPATGFNFKYPQSRLDERPLTTNIGCLYPELANSAQ